MYRSEKAYTFEVFLQSFDWKIYQLTTEKKSFYCEEYGSTFVKSCLQKHMYTLWREILCLLYGIFWVPILKYKHLTNGEVSLYWIATLMKN